MKNRSNIFKAISIWRLLEDISIKRKALNSRIVSMLEPYTFSLPGTFYLLCSGSGRAGKGFSKPELLCLVFLSPLAHSSHTVQCVIMPVPGTEPCGTGITFCLRVLPPIEESEDTSLLKTTHKLPAKIWILNIMKRPAKSSSTNEWWLLVLTLPPPLYQLSPQTLISQPTLIWYKRGGRERKASNWKVKLQEEKSSSLLKLCLWKLLFVKKLSFQDLRDDSVATCGKKAQTFENVFSLCTSHD